MAHRASFRRGISQSQRRKKSWIQVTGPAASSDGFVNIDTQTPNMNLFVPATGAGAFSVVQASAGLISDPVLDKIPAESTLLRLRGSMNLPKNEVASGAAALITTFAIAIGVMEAGAAALGAFPNPATPDGGAWDGWMFYRSQQAGSLDANASVFDVKSMRKIQSGSAFIVVFGEYSVTANNSVHPGLPDVSAQINMRGLILLP